MFPYENGGGFSHQAKLDYPSDDNDTLLSDLLAIFDKYIKNNKVRRIYISYGRLCKSGFDQVSLFEDTKTYAERKAFQKVSDQIRKKYGKNSLLRGSALLKESTAMERHEQIGGHKK